MEVLAIIPARSGSKSVKDKNIRLVDNKPLLAHSVAHALASKLITRTIISTDSEKYAEIAKEAGAEAPFIRPDEFATDTATDLEVFRHALLWLKEHEGYEPDVVVQLRPTYPKRKVEDIDEMIRLLLENDCADSVRSIAPAQEVAHKMWYFEPLIKEGYNFDAVECASSSLKTENESGKAENKYACTENRVQNGNSDIVEYDQKAGIITPIITNIPECYNMPRQELPKIYYQNACIDVTRPNTILNKNSMTGDVILGYLMDENLDIDTEAELIKAENELIKADNERLKAENERLKAENEQLRQKTK